MNKGFYKSGGAGRNRTDDRGFAVLGLTTWRPRLKERYVDARIRLDQVKFPLILTKYILKVRTCQIIGY